MASSAIPATKALAAKNTGVPDNGFGSYTAMGSLTHEELDYSKIPVLESNGQWLLVVPFRNKVKPKVANPSNIVIPDSAKNKTESYLVIGSNDGLKIKSGSIVKIMDSAKRAVPLEAALGPVFCNLEVFAINPESVLWVVPDTYLDKLVL